MVELSSVIHEVGKHMLLSFSMVLIRGFVFVGRNSSLAKMLAYLGGWMVPLFASCSNLSQVS